MGTMIQNSLGRRIDLCDPQVADMDMQDIAHALSLICRFGGHVKHFYSVAEHSLLVADLLEEQGHPSNVVLAGLLHDAHEAFIGDVTTPVKAVLRQHGELDELIQKFDLCIAEYAGLSPEMLHCPPVREADAAALFIEAQYLMPAGLQHFHAPGVSVPTEHNSSAVEWFSRASLAPSVPVAARDNFCFLWKCLSA